MVSSERHLRRLRETVLLAQVSVSLHREGPAIGVPQPARDGWDINARLDAAGGEEVPQIVVRHGFDADFTAGRFQRVHA